MCRPLCLRINILVRGPRIRLVRCNLSHGRIGRRHRFVSCGDSRIETFLLLSNGSLRLVGQFLRPRRTIFLFSRRKFVSAINPYH